MEAERDDGREERGRRRRRGMRRFSRHATRTRLRGRPRLPAATARVALSVGIAILAGPTEAETTRLPTLFNAVPHEIPADVVVRAFVRVEEGEVRVIVRVPLTSMRDVEFPVRGPGYVEIAETTPMLPDLGQLWIAGYLTLFAEGPGGEEIVLPAPVVTGARISLPSDPSFAGYDRARAHLSAPPLADGIDLVLEQAMLDVALSTPLGSAALQGGSVRLSIDPRWAHLGIRTTTVLRFVTAEGAERIFQYAGNPGRVRLDPRWHQAFLRFVALGFAHILDGIDHLLFLLCLVIPLRRAIPLIKVVTAFTMAHSITLGASVMGLAPNALWFVPLIELLIAVSIVFMALENIVRRTESRRWAWAFGFGLVHGFGFSFLLSESLQFAGSHLFTSLLGFNLGVELGQLFALLIMLPVLALLATKAPQPRVIAIVISALVAHTGWHWMTEKWAVFAAYDIRGTALGSAGATQWALLATIVLAAGWGLGAVYGRWGPRGATEPEIAKRGGTTSSAPDAPEPPNAT